MLAAAIVAAKISFERFVMIPSPRVGMPFLKHDWLIRTLITIKPEARRIAANIAKQVLRKSYQ